MTSEPLRLAVIGHPIAHSLSPRMHSRALEVLGVAGSYTALDVAPDALVGLVAQVRSGALDGVNVTIPHKVAVIPLLDELSEDARATGAVNTLVRDGARLVGENTDVGGLLRALGAQGVSVRERSVVILGAGGAARAAAAAARRQDAREIVIVARDRERALSLIAGPQEHAITFDDPAALRDALGRAELLLQASSATMGPDADAFVAGLPLQALADDAVVVDLVYRPRETALLRVCRARGLRALDGVEMLVWQGALALARWLGRPIEEMPVTAMRDAVLDPQAGAAP